MSSIVNKAKEAVDKVVHPSHHHTGAESTNAGPHNSNLANKADPRVDSDVDGSRNMGMASGNTGYSGTSYDTTNSATGFGSTNAGPHNSNLANKADPRVDSDMDGSRNMGMASGNTGYSGTSYDTTNSATGFGSTNAGPHNSNLANKADPRVNSGVDGSHTGGGNNAYTGTATAGMTGQHGQSGLTGTSGRSGLTGVAGTGPAPNTAGPHSSDMMNKVDPRIDSDLDGSRTVGGNKTYTNSPNQVPDASNHTPSEFRKRLSQEHHPGETDHARRHSLAELDTRGTLDKYGAGHQ